VFVEQAAVKRIVVAIRNPAAHTTVLLLERVLIVPPV
jgi:hypothetical protein